MSVCRLKRENGRRDGRLNRSRPTGETLECAWSAISAEAWAFGRGASGMGCVLLVTFSGYRRHGKVCLLNGGKSGVPVTRSNNKDVTLLGGCATASTGSHRASRLPSLAARGSLGSISVLHALKVPDHFTVCSVEASRQWRKDHFQAVERRRIEVRTETVGTNNPAALHTPAMPPSCWRARDFQATSGHVS